jgi:hypothetical protein
VAQFLNRGALDPAELAGVLADLSDTFAWAGPSGRGPVHAPTPRPLKAKAKALPAKRRYRTSDQIAAESEQCVDYIREHPGCTRSDVRRALWPAADKSRGAAMVQARLNAVRDRWRIDPGSGTAPDKLYIWES